MIKIIIGVVIAAIMVIGSFLVLDPSIGITNTGGQVTETVHTFTITVEGSVYKPGSYTLKDGSVMNDLLNAAGGITSSADSRAYYEEAILTQSTTYYIASRFDANDLCNNAELTKVNVNSDDAETLSTINGISPTIANSIVTYRNEHGLFSTLEELQEVYGIGSATYKKIRNYVILHA